MVLCAALATQAISLAQNVRSVDWMSEDADSFEGSSFKVWAAIWLLAATPMDVPTRWSAGLGGVGMIAYAVVAYSLKWPDLNWWYLVVDLPVGVLLYRNREFLRNRSNASTHQSVFPRIILQHSINVTLALLLVFTVWAASWGLKVVYAGL